MIKTITENTTEAFDEHVNAFEKLNNVFATQTHVIRTEGMPTQYIAVIFYRHNTARAIAAEIQAKRKVE